MPARPGKKPSYGVLEQFDYVDDRGHTFRVPAVAVQAEEDPKQDNATDFASIPWFLNWLVPADGLHTPAAILHDAMIGGQSGLHFLTDRPEPVDDGAADRIFREAMGHAGVRPLRKWLMWGAVALRTLIEGRRQNGKRGLRWWATALPVFGGLFAGGLLAALQAVLIPGFSHPWGSLPWIEDRGLVGRAVAGLLAIAVLTAATTLVVGLAFPRTRRSWAAGAIAGPTLGLLAFPMAVSFVGWAGYYVVESGWNLLARLTGGGRPATDRRLPARRT
jgi:hypothetical protein